MHPLPPPPPPGSFKTLEGWIKDLVCRNPTSVTPGVLELLLVGVSVPCSEAICETYGSMMEDYHSDRFVNPGPTNNDTRLQKEMFIRLNGPPLGNSTEFCSTIASRLNIAPTISYQQMHPANRRVTKSKVLKSITRSKNGLGQMAITRLGKRYKQVLFEGKLSPEFFMPRRN